MNRDEQFEQGMSIRHEMFGPGGAADAIANATPTTARFQEYVTRYCFGDTWSRPELSRRDRSLITVAMMVVMDKQHELGIHIRGALANGVTPEEILEVIMHSIPYSGLPTAGGALRTAEPIIGDDL